MSCSQMLHRGFQQPLLDCMAAMGDRGAFWLQLGFGRNLTYALTFLPARHAQMRVRNCTYNIPIWPSGAGATLRRPITCISGTLRPH